MDDRSPLEEILRSPLDDMPDGPSRRLLIGSGAFVAVLLLGFVGVTWLRGDVEPAAADPGAVATTAAPGEEAAGGSDAGAGADTTAAAPEPLVPESGRWHEMVALGEGRMLLFGGFVPLDQATAPFEGTWTFDSLTAEWSVEHPEIAPSPRFGHAMALHPPTGKVVVFGGGTTVWRPCPRIRFCPGPEDNQLWQFDPVTGVWEDMTPAVPDEETWPIPRFGTSFVYEPVTERLIMFGGVGVFGTNNTPNFWTDTWAYDPATNQWEDLTDPDEDTRPLGRVEYGLVWHEESRRILMFAGDGLSALDDDNLWAFDPATGVWEDLGENEAGEGPKDRWFHNLEIDPQSGRMVLFGGNGSIYRLITGGTIRNNGNLDEVWTWSPAEGWIAQNALDGFLIGAASAGDPATLGIIVYAGNNVWSYDVAVDVWTMLWERPVEDDAG